MFSENEEKFIDRVMNSEVYMTAYLTKHDDKNDRTAVYDFAIDFLHNEAELIESFEAEGSAGPFPVVIRGLDKIYKVFAPEFSLENFHLDIEDARAEAEDIYSNYV